MYRLVRDSQLTRFLPKFRKLSVTLAHNKHLYSFSYKQFGYMSSALSRRPSTNLFHCCCIDEDLPFTYRRISLVIVMRSACVAFRIVKRHPGVIGYSSLFMEPCKVPVRALFNEWLVAFVGVAIPVRNGAWAGCNRSTSTRQLATGLAVLLFLLCFFL